jgi:hypothetical protein
MQEEHELKEKVTAIFSGLFVYLDPEVRRLNLKALLLELPNSSADNNPWLKT